MGESSKIQVIASKVVALVGILIAIGDGIDRVIIGIRENDPNLAVWGVLIILVALILFLSLGLIDLRNFKLPYEWWFLLICGIILVVLWWFNRKLQLASGVLILSASLLELLYEKKKYRSSKIIAFVGSCFAIVESALGIASRDEFNMFWGVIGVVTTVFLLLSLQKKIKVNIPYTWYFLLIVGFILFTWIEPMGYYVSGKVVMVAFILRLMAY